MTRTVAIIQARMGSSRLPGKVLMELAGETILAHVLRRARAIPGIDAVCCAIPDNPDDDMVAAEAARLGALVSRGPEADVLERYRKAAAECGAGVVLRATSDCPYLDPEVCGALIRLRAAENADFGSNNAPPGWPHGMDCEIFTSGCLTRAAREADQPIQREHVGPWMRTAPGLKRVSLTGPGGDWMRWRLTIDFPEDLVMFRRLNALLPAPPAMPGVAEIAAVLARHPDIGAINHARHVKASV
jgi:spore coat polysaccharide biosynthesis protein SpsF (cytidylyltransferase family)